jgi:betaine-homocysteine S-methyltransferase
LIAVDVIKAHGLPAVINFGSVHDQTKDGHSYAEACKIAEDRGADVVGLNCSRGPKTLLPLVAQVRAAVDGHVAAVPVPYRTTESEPTFVSLRDGELGQAFPIGLDPFTSTRFEMADFTVQAKEMGVRFIGICCGGAPHHVRAMAEALGRTVPASRYSPDLSMHPALGTKVKDRDQEYLGDWKD